MKTSLLFALFLSLILSAAPRDPSWKETPFFETAPEPVLTAEEVARGLMLFSRPITEPIYPETRPYGFERIESLASFATPGEFEPVLVGIYPTKDIQNLRVSVNALSGPAGVIPAEAFDIRHGRYSDMRYPLYTTKGTYRRVAELLEKSESFSFPARECQQWWLTVKVPENAKPGIYRGFVLVSAEGLKEIKIPYSLRVLSFTLKKDPAKHYTAYHYDLLMRYKNTLQTLDPSLTNEEGLSRLSLNEYRVMRDFGFDSAPTGYYSYDVKNNLFYFRGTGGFDLMRQAGLLQNNSMFAVLGNGIGGLYQKYMKEWIPPHCAVTNLPPQAFFDEVTELTLKAEEERKKNHWPEFIYNPLDEVDASAWEFGVRTHMAVKKAGVKTYTTKDPKSFDAAKYADCIDVWCSQPFSMSYEEVVADKKFKYWSYPNHVSGELKSREIMMKGGRMTYGYGFWRSGYEGLIPWMWRWDVGDPGDYLDDKVADTGNKLSREGEIIPAAYWLSFREGVDDEKYIYTLQQAIVDREKTKDASARALIDEGKKFLRELWESIEVQDKYLAVGMWPSEDFNEKRWQMARLIESLQKFPEEKGVVSPSVLLPGAKKNLAAGKSSALEDARRKGLVEEVDLGDEDFSRWQNITMEGNLETTSGGAHRGDKAMKWTVHMDHSTDGEAGSSGSGKYPKGWPRILLKLPEAVDLGSYDYLSLWVKIDSDRDEVADDMSPLHLDIITASGKYQRRLLNEAEQRVWIPIVVPVSELIVLAGDSRNVKELKSIQLWIPEGSYPDKSTVTFSIDEFALLRFKQPVLDALEVPSVSLIPANFLPVNFRVFGDSSASRGQYQAGFSLFDEKGGLITSFQQDLKDGGRFGLGVGKVKTPGRYVLRSEILRGKESLSRMTSPVEFVKGPLE